MKTIFDYHKLFGITTGVRYHAYDYAVQVCYGSFKLYSESKTDSERNANWKIAEIVASRINAPIPVDGYWRERKNIN